MKVRELVAQLQALPQDKELVCQVVPEEPYAGAWIMSYAVADVPHSWMVALTVSHPNLRRLSPQVVLREINPPGDQPYRDVPRTISLPAPTPDQAAYLRAMLEAIST